MKNNSGNLNVRNHVAEITETWAPQLTYLSDKGLNAFNMDIFNDMKKFRIDFNHKESISLAEAKKSIFF